MRILLSVCAASVFLTACQSTPPSDGTATEAEIAAYKSTVAIPADAPNPPWAFECYQAYASGQVFLYGTTPETRWSRDVEPCLKFGLTPDTKIRYDVAN